jgi:hypothetical protein
VGFVCIFIGVGWAWGIWLEIGKSIKSHQNINGEIVIAEPRRQQPKPHPHLTVLTPNQPISRDHARPNLPDLPRPGLPSHRMPLMLNPILLRRDNPAELRVPSVQIIQVEVVGPHPSEL